MLERTAFGGALQRARVTFLDGVTASERTLIVGEGNGCFLAELLRRSAGMAIDCVDSSAVMVRLARERLRPSVMPSRGDGEEPHNVISDAREIRAFGRDGERTKHDVRFHHADISQWRPDCRGYDLIVTHFFLDCFDRDELPRVIDKIDSFAAPNARWLISDFNLPAQGLRRLHARVWLRAMYSFFHIAADLETRELVPYGSLLRKRGFHLVARRDSHLDLITAQLWQR